MLTTAFLLMASMAAGQAGESSDSLVYPQLKALECFIGDWESKVIMPAGTTASELLGEVAKKQVSLTLTVRWAPGKSSQIIHIEHRLEGTTPIKGAGLRGWDESTQQIRDYMFTTHKGTWSGTWKQDGDIWIFEYEGTNLDRKKASGTRRITFKEEDHFIERDVNQLLDGKPQPDVELHFTRK